MFMKKNLSVLLFCAVLPLIFCVPARAEVSVSARACVLYCANNGELLYSLNEDERLPMASTTKIMTALITLEEAARDDRVVTFTPEMFAEGSSMYLLEGERITLDDLAVGMLMQSGNDAANAAAVAISGSIEAFAERMNERAKELGMENTRFVTPSGLDSDGHFSTARDMAILLNAAMDNARFREITGSESMTVSFTEPADKVVTYPNHNKLLRLYPDCAGGKTGYTDLAGRCLVTCAERGGLRLIAVTLNDGDDWNDHIGLYDYGFSSYSLYAQDMLSYTVPVVGGVAENAVVCAEPSAELVLPSDSVDRVEQEIFLPPFIYAPVQRGDKVGRVIYTLDGERIAEHPLISADNIEYNVRRRGFIDFLKDLLNWHNR